jgi:hypothetical protein
MMAARASVPGTPTAADPSRPPTPTPGPVDAPRTLSPAGNRAVARSLADAAASRTLTVASGPAPRMLARCPGCGGRCGGAKTELDEDLLANGQRALRRAVLARRALSPRF